MDPKIGTNFINTLYMCNLYALTYVENATFDYDFYQTLQATEIIVAAYFSPDRQLATDFQ